MGLRRIDRTKLPPPLELCSANATLEEFHNLRARDSAPWVEDAMAQLVTWLRDDTVLWSNEEQAARHSMADGIELGLWKAD